MIYAQKSPACSATTRYHANPYIPDIATVITLPNEPTNRTGELYGSKFEFELTDDFFFLHYCTCRYTYTNALNEAHQALRQRLLTHLYECIVYCIRRIYLLTKLPKLVTCVINQRRNENCESVDYHRRVIGV